MGAKLKTQKNAKGFQQNPKKSLNHKLTHKKSHAEFLTLKILNIKNIRNTPKCIQTPNTSFDCALFKELWSQGQNMPKNPYLNETPQKNTCQIFLLKKIPETKISNPKKILLSSPLHEIPSTPQWVGRCLFHRGKERFRLYIENQACTF